MSARRAVVAAQALNAPVDAAEPERPLVRVSDVAYRYPDGTEALGDVSLTLGRHEVVAIVGPSGSGKSTLLGLLAGSMAPSAGRIEWDPGLADRAPRPRMTLMFQRDTLLPWKTVAGNVTAGLKYQHVPRREQNARATSLLEMVGLSDRANAFPYQLSGGMRRRVAFLSCVAPQPAVLVLDEPFMSLDEPTRVAIHAEVLKIVRSVGMSVILVTHDIAEAVSLSDRVYVLTKAPGTIKEVFSIPFGPDRDIATLREDPVFLETYAAVWHVLHQQILEPGA